MTGKSLLALYGTPLFAASLLGSGLPRIFRITHIRTQMVLNLISGMMLGVALLHLIPHAFATGLAINMVMILTLSGLIFMLLLLRWFHSHQHDFASATADCELALADEHHHACPWQCPRARSRAGCRCFVRGVVCAHCRRRQCPWRGVC